MPKGDTSLMFVAFAERVQQLAREAECLASLASQVGGLASRLGGLASRLEVRQDKFAYDLAVLLGKVGRARPRSRRIRGASNPVAISVLLIRHLPAAGSTLFIDGLASSAFSVEQFKDFSGIMQRLRHQSDPVSAYLWRSLSSRDQVLLMTDRPTGPSLRRAKDIVVQALNKLIGESCFYDVERFKRVSLRTETSDLMKLTHLGSNLSLLNRFLLEDAYPLELSRIPGIDLPPLVAVLMETLQADTGITTDPYLVGWKSVGAVQAAIENATNQQPTARAIKQLVFRLRRLLEGHGERPSLVQNHPRLGYRFAVRRGIKASAKGDNH